MNTLTRLQPGMVVAYDGRPHRVVMVNECRARIEPVTARQRVITPQTGAHAGRQIAVAVREAHNVSPNAELEILQAKTQKGPKA